MAKETSKRKKIKKRKVIKKSPRLQPTSTPEELLNYYKDMLLIRRFEEKAGQLYGMSMIAGFCHLYIGQEAVVVGMQAAANREIDTVITSYRDHGHMLASNMDPKGVMAELTGRSGGDSKGKREKFFRRTRNCWCSSTNRNRPRVCSQIQKRWWCLHDLFW